ncbi:MAG: hypothetical protein AAGE88_19180 [Actinomycetota bacterium]
MELDSQALSSFVLGMVVGLLACIAIFVLARRQLRLNNRTQIEQYEQTILDLRQERAEGREANRRLRHELAVSTPEHLEQTRADLADATERIESLEADLLAAGEQLTVRDRSLREARLAIQEIRLQLEAGRIGDASAQSAEYLDHGIDPDEQQVAAEVLAADVLAEFLDDGVVAAEPGAGEDHGAADGEVTDDSELSDDADGEDAELSDEADDGDDAGLSDEADDGDDAGLSDGADGEDAGLSDGADGEDAGLSDGADGEDAELTDEAGDDDAGLTDDADDGDDAGLSDGADGDDDAGQKCQGRQCSRSFTICKGY